ncbi:MAG: SUMF1/EgtB/PvdO family nonheme iron enzyme [Alphaproteobacteria bacterium]|nr:SUMF1/EgtB/PvdO family nonheme iron enzyme [Alphaproteobacteria bacterium]
MLGPFETLAEAHGVPPELWPAVRAMFDAHEARTFQAFGSMAPVTLAGTRDAAPAAPPTDLVLPARYEDLGLIGVGGMGEVRRVRDRVLHAVRAMKVMHADLCGHPTLAARFVEEAQAQAQLVHPGIVPVHELGTLADGRPYFTMALVQGRTLSDVLAVAHPSRRTPTHGAEAWSLRRLVEAFARVCEAVAYAHDRGVVHRDLKPDNVVVGGFGEVMVLDWGLAKVLGRVDRVTPPGGVDPVHTGRSADAVWATRVGAVAGTPAYMAPEQARGEVDRIDARTDVYALGAMLYEVLTGEAPYAETSPPDVIAALRAGARPTAAGARAANLPRELVEACERAMAWAPDDRFATAALLAAELMAWLEGARRREQALAVVDAAQAHGPRAAALRRAARDKREAARACLEAVPTWAPADAKVEGWALEDDAAALELEAELEELALDDGLQGALRTDTTLPEAHAALAERRRAAHQVAEVARDRFGAARAERRLRQHVAALPDDHPVRVACTTYLRGDGAITLVTDPPGAEVVLERFVERDRRLVPEPVRVLGRTPLRAVSVPMGSYQLRILAEGREEVRYPVRVPRSGHWHGVAPGAAEPHPIWLPPVGAVGADACYVPAGWFEAGGDPQAGRSLPRQDVWLPGFVMSRHPVTNRAYLAFLNDLVANGREAEARAWVPSARPAKAGEPGVMIYGRRPDGTFELAADADGDVWLPDWPVAMVDLACAEAYAAWQSARTSQAWALPTELQWEKAGRGVDGRSFPWGDAFDPSWCCMTDSHEGRKLPVEVDAFPTDVSVYGVRGLGGNMRDWTATTWHRPEDPPVHDPDPDTPRVTRGGLWFGREEYVRLARRDGDAPVNRFLILSFRLCRPVP